MYKNAQFSAAYAIIITGVQLDEWGLSSPRDAGRFASGIYYYQLVAGVYMEVKKMVFLKW